MNQIRMVCLEQLVSEDHVYRKYLKLIDFDTLLSDLKKELANWLGCKGFGLNRLFRCLLLQALEDLSDREMESFLSENLAGKLFCGFNLGDATPSYSSFSKARKRIGTNRMSQLFVKIKEQLNKQGYASEIFNFVDASHLISKSNLWEERDKAIQAKYEKLNNANISKFSSDKEARIGSKGTHKFWFGFKKHANVDMQSGIITAVSITAAHVADAEGLRDICPHNGVVFGDKGYCVEPAPTILRERSCDDATIKKDNMHGKDFDRDKWRSKMRAPYERIFSKTNHRARYKGIEKNQFFAYLEAMGLNLKRLVVLEAPPIFA